MFKVIDTQLISSAKVIEAVEVKVLAGEGTEESPRQLVIYYFDRDGHWLATRNPPIKLEEPK